MSQCENLDFGSPQPRREFLRSAAMGVAASAVFGLTLPDVPATGADAAAPWSFGLLGDTHFDRLEHHDLKWLAVDHPGDVEQVRRYSDHAAKLLPKLFQTLRKQIAAGGATFDSVLHVGDFVEGLCGNAALAERHVREGLEFLVEAAWNVPLVLTKGNHDVTGPGAVEAYDKLMLPLLAKTLQEPITKARYAVERRGALFACYDCYDKTSLAWLKETLGARRRTTGPTFVVVHQPIVPFQARGNWCVFIKPEQHAQRDELLNLLGDHRAIVLCGHVHRYGLTVRNTDHGPFTQLALSSILSGETQEPQQVLVGLDNYGPELTELEPSFQPNSKEERHKIFVAEKPHLSKFEYANTAGYAVLHVAGMKVTADMYNGTSMTPWKTIDLTPTGS